MQAVRGYQYEAHAALVLRKYGFKWTQDNGSPGDKGIDLRGYFTLPDLRFFDVIAQCKCTTRPSIGPSPVRDLIGIQSIVNSRKTNSASSLFSIFISNRKLSKASMEMIAAAPLPMAFVCIAHNDLTYQGETGHWQDEVESFFLNMNLQRLIPGLSIRNLDTTNGSFPMVFFEDKKVSTI